MSHNIVLFIGFYPLGVVSGRRKGEILEIIGKVKDISRDFWSDRVNLTLSVVDVPEGLKGDTDYRITIKEYRKSRSIDANALLWACIGELSTAIKSDKWSVYLELLKRYGKYVYVCVPPGKAEDVKKQWRECEEIGTVDINGRKATQLLCYFGSSTYDSKEFGELLDGVVSEMREVGLTPPPSKDMQRAIEAIERRENKANG